MKKSHIALLILIAIMIVGILMYGVDFSTYSTITSAQKNPGKFVHIIARLDTASAIEYDPIKNPNFLSFYAVDSLGGRTKVVYHKEKPTDIEKSERLVLKGKMEKEFFDCSDILLKCPSKYKDNKQNLQNNMMAIDSTK